MKRRGQIPIPIPNPIRTDDSRLNREFDVVRRSIQQLAARLPERDKTQPREIDPDTGLPWDYSHPFKMIVNQTTNELTVLYGQMTLAETKGTGSADIHTAFNSELVSKAATALTATTGVWAYCDYTVVEIPVNDEYRIVYGAELYDFDIILDTTNTAATNYATLNSLGDAYHFIGQVELSGTDWIIHQHLRSDITFSLLDRPADYISTDANNILTQAALTDNLLLVDGNQVKQP